MRRLARWVSAPPSVLKMACVVLSSGGVASVRRRPDDSPDASRGRRRRSACRRRSFKERVGRAGPEGRRVRGDGGVAATSCTTALHLSFIASGIGPGDEVICPSYSFIASANAIVHAGATPVFADIEDDTWNLDPSDVARRVTSRTKAVLAVHQVGLAADLDRIREAVPDRVAIVEDAACAIGSLYKGRPIGSHGHLTCLSFHPRKTISLGEGGMLLTDDAAVACHVRTLRSHGASVSDLA